MATSSAPLTTNRTSSGTSHAASARHPTGSAWTWTARRGTVRAEKGGADARWTIGEPRALCAPGDEVVEAKVPDGGDAGADQVGQQIMDPEFVVEVEEHP